MLNFNFLQYIQEKKGSEFSSYKIELRKMTSHFEKFFFDLLTRFCKMLKTRFTNSMAKLLFYHFRVTNSRFRNKKFHLELLIRSWKKKFHFELPTRFLNLYFLLSSYNSIFENIKLHFQLIIHSREMLEIQFNLSPAPSKSHQEKTSPQVIVLSLCFLGWIY